MSPASDLSLMPPKFPSINIAALLDTHSPVLMSIFVIAMLVFALTWTIETQLETRNNSYHHVLISNIRLLSGSLAAILPVLVIFPVLGWSFLLVWTLFLVKLIYNACQKLLQLYQAISSASDVFNEVLGRGAHGLPV
ncbi:hypothetical protein REPUB_Repub03eG0228500 [Reevesia pubescens]